MASKFEYAQAEEVRDVFARHGVRYLFLGKSGAILLGLPDTTQAGLLECDAARAAEWLVDALHRGWVGAELGGGAARARH